MKIEDLEVFLNYDTTLTVKDCHEALKIIYMYQLLGYHNKPVFAKTDGEDILIIMEEEDFESILKGLVMENYTPLTIQYDVSKEDDIYGVLETTNGIITEPIIRCKKLRLVGEAKNFNLMKKHY